ncbi:hypothetical protein [Acidovorax radicis]|nr:hypothetical protein [Acidovorax radicis]UCV01626.1 hypothetical protein KI609_15760 [Acidovorax radicis]
MISKWNPTVYFQIIAWHTGFNPMTYEEAVDREIEIGIDLRSAGFGVWQA